MNIYRWGGVFKQISLSYSLAESEHNRLEKSYVDRTALNSLMRVISGGIETFNDLEGAERALRALCFHESVHEIAPCANLRILLRNGNSFDQTVTQDTIDRSPIQSTLDEANFHVYIAPVDQLFSFEDTDYEHAYVVTHNKKCEQESPLTQKLKELGLPPPEFQIDFERLPFVKASDSIKEYFEKVVFETKNRAHLYLKPLAVSGRAAYIGDALLSSSYERLRNSNATNFFKTMDLEWSEWALKMRRVLDIPIPPLLAIVLNRSASREDIPRHISQLRSEMRLPSQQLWELFDDAEFRITSESVSYRILNDIEREARTLFDNWKSRDQFNMPFKFGMLDRLIALDALGLLKDLGGLLADWTFKDGMIVDAAQVTRENLETVEFRELVGRHFTDQEQSKLANSLPF